MGAATARVAVSLLARQQPDGQWGRRVNYRGATVSLSSGPGLALATAVTGPGLAGVVAGIGAGIAGAYDDLHADQGEDRGFRGHLSALRRHRLTAGAVKLVGVSATGVLAALCLRPRRDVLVTGAVIAGSANLINLLDLRPGRALKVGLAAGAALGQPGVIGSCAALLPADLGERQMLGDTGANALGAVLGVALVRRLPSRTLRRLALVTLIGLTAASERVSFSEVIERTPALRRLDQLGRRP